MDGAGTDIAVLSVAPPLFLYWTGAGRCRRGGAHHQRRDRHDGRAGATSVRRTGHPADAGSRRGGRRVTALLSGDLGMRGAQIGPHVEGVPLDDESLRPVLRAAEELGVPLMLHPYYVGSSPGLDDFYLTNLQGNPWQTALSASRLILSGTLDALPGLDLVLVHGGGHLPYQIGRLDHGYRVRPEASSLPHTPSDYLRRFHYDTLTHSPAATQLAHRPGRLRPGAVRHRHPVRHGRWHVRRTARWLPRFRRRAGVRSPRQRRPAVRTRTETARMPEQILLHIDGKDVAAGDGGAFEVHNPATGELLHTVADGTCRRRRPRCAGSHGPPSTTGAGTPWRPVTGPASSTAPPRCWPTASTSTRDWRRLQIGRPLREMRAQLQPIAGVARVLRCARADRRRDQPRLRRRSPQRGAAGSAGCGRADHAVESPAADHHEEGLPLRSPPETRW